MTLSQKTNNQIIRAITRLRSFVRQTHACASNKISFVKMMTLHFVYETKHPTMKEIASFLEITMPSTTTLIEDLVRLGLIRRIRDESDKRVVRVALTTQGNLTMKKQFSSVKDALRTQLQKLTTQEQKQLLSILLKLHKHT